MTLTPRFRTVVAVLALAASVLVSCSGATTPIPAGGQQVRIQITASEVRLDSATVRAGDVYLVLDSPSDGSFVLVEGKRAAEATPGPLSDEDLARLARGDKEGTSIGGLEAGGCGAEQDAAARGHMGRCGNVMKVVLAEGKYAIFADAPEGDPTTGRLPPMAVLEVVP